MSICYFEGAFRPVSECRLPVTDLVIQRGVGVFDSLRLYEGKPFAAAAHMERLENSAKAAGMNISGETINEITRVIREGARRPDCPDSGECVIKPYITGGDSVDRGFFPNPRWFVVFEGGMTVHPEEYENGIALQPTRESRPYPLVKSVNYLVGLMQEAGRSDILECLYCPGGHVLETLKSSFFIISGGKLITAPVGSVLGGVTRSIVIQLARENGIQVDERIPDISELETADEAFLTGTWKEVLPVVRVGDTVIGGGKPGPITRRLHGIYRENLRRWLDDCEKG
jgi:branched-chain amino acid aminotransferase